VRPLAGPTEWLFASSSILHTTCGLRYIAVFNKHTLLTGVIPFCLDRNMHMVKAVLTFGVTLKREEELQSNSTHFLRQH